MIQGHSIKKASPQFFHLKNRNNYTLGMVSLEKKQYIRCGVIVDT